MRAPSLKAVAAVAAASALLLTACSSSGDDDPEAATDLQLVVGTTDAVTNIDPAGEYDHPSNNIVDSIYQKLLRIPPGESEPVPELAESCDFEDDVTFVCTLREGFQFSDGSPVEVEDVVHSFERQLVIQHESNGWTLLNGINPDEGGSIEARDASTVVFNLAAADAAFPLKLTTGNGGSIVPRSYPMDALQPNDQVIGSGPYVIGEFDVSQRITLEPNESYTGDVPAQNGGVILQIYQNESALKQAIEEGQVMVAYRNLGVVEIADLEENGASFGVEVVRGEGAEINYLVLQASRAPFDNVAVRQAVAQVIDRQVIAESVYRGTVRPLYGPVPEGFAPSTPSFQTRYGEPNVEEAQRILDDAGVETPVAFDLWWMPDRYGVEIADMYAEIERQLDDSGLFDVTLESLSWDTYSTTFGDGSMDAFDLGWFPDFPDYSNYLEGFYNTGDRNFLANGYGNEEVDQLLETVVTATDETEREAAATRISEIIAEEAPVIQLWQRNSLAAIRTGVEGVEETLDIAFNFRFYNVTGTAN